MAEGNGTHPATLREVNFAVNELRGLVQNVVTAIAVITDQNARMREDTERNGQAIVLTTEAIRNLEKMFAVYQERQNKYEELSLERTRKVEEAIKRIDQEAKVTQGFVRENWTKIVELTAAVAMLTKAAGLW